MNIEDQAKQFADFITVTCLEWKHVLYEDRFKDIVVESLSLRACRFKQKQEGGHLCICHHVKSLPFDLANAWRP